MTSGRGSGRAVRLHPHGGLPRRWLGAQRPLATVVIGGLLTSTPFTLYVLPIIYRWMVADNSNGTTKKLAAQPVAVG